MVIKIDDFVKTGQMYSFQSEIFLTAREKQILTMLKEGKTVKEIAQTMKLPFPEAQKLIYFIQSKVERMREPIHK